MQNGDFQPTKFYIMAKVLITGAGKGIGRALALRFAEAGHELYLNSRTGRDLETLQGEINEKFKSGVSLLLGDVGSKEFCKEMADQIEDLDVLINNAGVFKQDSLVKGEEGLVMELWKTNTMSAYYLSRFLYPKLKQSAKPHIFNICSVAALRAYPNSGAYTISKYAMLGLSNSLRLELQEENIRVTAVHPGATLTNSWSGVDIPEERFIKAEDIAEMILSTYHLSKAANVDEILIRPSMGDIA